MNALHFGAGNIGRGFIGLLLSSNGFQVCFADVSDVLIDAIKEEGKYRVILADESHEAISVEGVLGINSAKEPEALKEAVLQADLITTAVGVSIVPISAGHFFMASKRGFIRRRSHLLASSPVRMPWEQRKY